MKNLVPKLRNVSMKLATDPGWIGRRLTGRFRPPLFVLQMGKVGSSTVKNTLESRYRVFHGHARSELESWLSTLGPRHHGKTIDVITATRDPISREISGFFQNITYVGHSYGVGTPDEVRALGVPRLIGIFKERWARRQHVPDTHLWFDRCFLPATGVDLYAHDFDRERGWSIVKEGRWRILVMRFENINRNYLEAVNAFVTERFGASAAFTSLRDTNVSTDKWYSDLMKEFKRTITFTPQEIAEQYDTKYCRHFYTGEEIRELKSRWPIREDQGSGT
jgi:hypothetical protein